MTTPALPEIRLPPRSIAALRGILGREAQFNLLLGKLEADRHGYVAALTADALAIQHWPRQLGHARRDQGFCYFSARRPKTLLGRSWLYQEMVVLPRLPVGALRRFYQPAWMGTPAVGGVSVTLGRGLRWIQTITVYEECVPVFSCNSEEETTLRMDRRIVFQEPLGDAVAIELGDYGEPNLLICSADRRPGERSFNSLRCRLVLKREDRVGSWDANR